jgi:hypothetical protein
MEVSAIFKITESNEGAQTLVIIDGQLLGESVITAENYCIQALASGKAISLVLRDVSVIDDSGRRMLHRLAQCGVRLHGMGLYTSHIVKTLRRDAGGSRTSASNRIDG